MKTVALMVSILTAMLVGGCCAPETVLVPVYRCPAPPTMTMPELAVTQLSDKPITADVLQAMVLDHKTLKGTLEQCIMLLDGYRPQP